jgi:hypothetical protein
MVLERDLITAKKIVENYNWQVKMYKKYETAQEEIKKLEIAREYQRAKEIVENYNWHLRKNIEVYNLYNSAKSLIEKLSNVEDPTDELNSLLPYTAAHSILSHYQKLLSDFIYARNVKIDVEKKQKVKTILLSEKKSLTEKISQLQKEETLSLSEIARLTAEIEYEENRLSKFSKSAKNQQTYKLYKNILRPNGGIGDKLLESGRVALEAGINAGLVEFGAKFRIQIMSDYNIYLNNKESSSISISLSSGYQKFVLNLAARLAIWRLTAHTRPDAFIIDEGFGACDEEYLDSMITALEILAQSPDGPKLLFVVTHLENMKVKLERILQIQIKPENGNTVNNCEQKLQSLRIQTPRSNIPNINSLILPDDPNQNGNVYCAACNQSIKKSHSRRHLESRKHTSAREIPKNALKYLAARLNE